MARRSATRVAGSGSAGMVTYAAASRLEAVELQRVLPEDLALHLRREGRHLLRHGVERLGVQAGRVGEVGLEENAVRPDRLDERRQVVLLEPEGGVEISLEVL